MSNLFDMNKNKEEGKMDLTLIRLYIRKIKELENLNAHPFRKQKLKKWRAELLALLPDGVSEFDDDVIYKAVNVGKPYLQFYTQRTWAKSQAQKNRDEERNSLIDQPYT